MADTKEVEFHVTLNKDDTVIRKDIVTLSLSHIKEGLANHFNLNQVTDDLRIQLFSNAYSDWIDISCDDTRLKNGGKLQVIIMKKTLVEEANMLTAPPPQVPSAVPAAEPLPGPSTEPNAELHNCKDRPSTRYPLKININKHSGWNC